jgi:ribosomal protein L31
MHQLVSDKNFRIFTDDTWIYVFNRDLFIRSTDPQEIFAQLEVTEPSHAFYLGKELERAALSVQLGKKYTQEEPLRWGYLSDRRMSI